MELAVYESEYSVDIREARTGRSVASFVLPGNVSDDNSCPSSIDYIVGNKPDLARGLGGETFTEALRSFVDDAVGSG